MGDTSMVRDDDLTDYNGEVLEDRITEETPKAPNQGDRDVLAELEWTLDDEQKVLSETKYGDETYYEPFTPKPPRGSVKDIQHRLRVTGIRLRKDLNHSLHTNPDQWTALRRPASLHTAQRTLAEMTMIAL